MNIYKFAYKAEENSVTCYVYLVENYECAAYNRAVYEEIPRIINKVPYKVWLCSVGGIDC